MWQHFLLACWRYVTQMERVLGFLSFCTASAMKFMTLGVWQKLTMVRMPLSAASAITCGMYM